MGEKRVLFWLVFPANLHWNFSSKNTTSSRHNKPDRGERKQRLTSSELGILGGTALFRSATKIQLIFRSLTAETTAFSFCSNSRVQEEYDEKVDY